MIENAKLSESKVLNENKSKIIKIKRVNNQTLFGKTISGKKEREFAA